MAHLLQELQRCERAAEEILEHCATLAQRDAVEGRAGLLRFLHHSPEAARLARTHHVIYQVSALSPRVPWQVAWEMPHLPACACIVVV